MQFAVYLTIFLVLIAIALCIFLLQKVSIPNSSLEKNLIRIAVLEQMVTSLSSIIRDESKTSRDDLRSVLSAQTEAIDGVLVSIGTRLGDAAKAQIDQLTAMRSEASEGRIELNSAFRSQTEALEKRFAAVETRLSEFGKLQNEQLLEMRRESADGRTKLESTVRLNAEGFAASQAERLKETSENVRTLSERLLASQREGRDEQRLALDSVQSKIAALTESNDKRQEALRETVSSTLNTLRTENAEKLEKMRETVEEKLQGTLEKRLGESFKLVSDRLEQVHKGLGEMQTLATGVGDLKRVLSNVKSRGGWGEVQLGMLLGDMLTQDQFSANVHIRPDSSEVVEYAVRLPGQGDGDMPIWLPIDAKFPQEDYERLLQAQDRGVVEEVEKAASALENVIRLQAKTISEKYVHPPHSTDFAIMYLPTEGLFAEVIRRPGLAHEMQTKHRVMIQGPTTLAALLNSLQMGFRTLAIQKRSSEVWKVLGEAKAEFTLYGKVWEKLGKQLDTARKTVDEAGRRTRAVSRKLRDVEMLEGSDISVSTDIFLEEEEASDVSMSE